MAESHNTFEDRITRSARDIAASGFSRSITVAVLGPALNNQRGGQKRRQIHEALKNDGHNPFFLEDCVINDPTAESILDQERTILSDPGVDLVIILQTRDSVGVIAEISNFVSVPEIKFKAAILSPAEFYNPNESVVANTVRDYFIKMPYTNRLFNTCQLVSECRKWANDVAIRGGLIGLLHDPESS